jgi:hypothetical protein
MNRKTDFAQNPNMFFHKICAYIYLKTFVLRLFILFFHLGVISRNLKFMFSSENFRSQNFKKP